MSNASFDLFISVVSSCRKGAHAVKVANCHIHLVTMFPVIVARNLLASSIHFMNSIVATFTGKEIPQLNRTTKSGRDKLPNPGSTPSRLSTSLCAPANKTMNWITLAAYLVVSRVS